MAGAPARFVAPGDGWRARLITRLGNLGEWRALRRRTIARLPFPTLRSDVRGVTYATWLVPVAAVASLIPPRVRVIERGGLTPLTVLSYRHGHFGPALFGPLRRLFPSPLQSNWRLYVAAIDGVAPERPTVLFVANLFDSALYALGTRLFSDALPSHLPARFGMTADEIAITGGNGSAPSLLLRTRPAAAMSPPAPITAWFGTTAAALDAICLQDAALAATPTAGWPKRGSSCQSTSPRSNRWRWKSSGRGPRRRRWAEPNRRGASAFRASASRCWASASAKRSICVTRLR